MCAIFANASGGCYQDCVNAINNVAKALNRIGDIMEKQMKAQINSIPVKNTNSQVNGRSLKAEPTTEVYDSDPTICKQQCFERNALVSEQMKCKKEYCGE